MNVHAASSGGAPQVDVARRRVVDRILRTADELERRARAALAAPGPALVLVSRAGAVRAGARERVLLGRSPGCDVVLPSQHVSRAHAALVRRAGAWWIEDLGSRNGTWCGGERVVEHRLEGEALILLGDEPVCCRLR